MLIYAARSAGCCGISVKIAVRLVVPRNVIIKAEKQGKRLQSNIGLSTHESN